MGFLDKKAERGRAAKLAKRDARKLEQDANDLLRGFKERREAEAERRKMATDTEYWVAICFANRADKDAFVAKYGLLGCPLIPGTPGNKYVSGPDLDRELEKRTKTT